LAWANAEHTQIKGRRLADVPDKPKDTTTTVSGSNIIINWKAPDDNGSDITGYNVEIRQRDNRYASYTGCTGNVFSCTVPISVLQDVPYNLAIGDSVYARIKAINAKGISAASNNGDWAKIPATVPSTPSAPTTTVSGTNVSITWAAPGNSGLVITGYNVEIRQSDDTTYASYTGCTGTAVCCTVPISVLKAAPYNLANGSSVFA
jgi:hypothetical protein